MILKLLRNALGMIVVFVSYISLPKKMPRPESTQNEIEKTVSKLKIYQFYACPFCVKTRRVIHKLNLPIEFRSASHGSQYRVELEKEGGKVQVPCLRIEKDGKFEWMYESSAIIDYLEAQYS